MSKKLFWKNLNLFGQIFKKICKCGETSQTWSSEHIHGCIPFGLFFVLGKQIWHLTAIFRPKIASFHGY